jgi:hypothetical protein
MQVVDFPHLSAGISREGPSGRAQGQERRREVPQKQTKGTKMEKSKKIAFCRIMSDKNEKRGAGRESQGIDEAMPSNAG